MKLPELGENIEGGDVLRVIVAPGDTVTKDQPVLELETDKATIEVPATVAGVIKEAKVKQGQKVKVGETIFVVDESGAGASAPKAESKAAPAAAAPAPAPPAESPAPKPAPVQETPKIEKRRADVVEMKPSQPKPAPAPAATTPDAASIAAAPSARRLARELGVNIQEMQGSGPGGRISMDDVTAYARRLLAGGAGRPAAAPAAALPDFSKWGAIERKPMSGVRRTTAHRLTQAWNTVPHVFQQDRADITAVEALRKRLSKKSGSGRQGRHHHHRVSGQGAGRRAQEVPAAELVGRHANRRNHLQDTTSHVGVAVDTDRGLLVPVIRDVDTKDISQLADEIAQAADKARSRKLSIDDMQGASMSLSNLGSLGGGPFTPIVNWPEVAILGVSRARMEPVFIDGEFVPRFMMPLTLSYDHRVVDGADGVRILRWIVEAIEQPALIWLDA